MPRDGAGNYTLPLADVVTGTTILSAWANPTMADVKSALTASIAKDGQTNPSANLPMNGFKHTGVGAASMRTDYASVADVQDSLPNFCGNAGGTADALTVPALMALAAYVDGQIFWIRATATNTTTAPTLKVGALAAITIKKAGGVALEAGGITTGSIYGFIRDVTQACFTLINPAKQGAGYWYQNGPCFGQYLTSDFNTPSGSTTELGSVLSDFTSKISVGSGMDLTTGRFTVPAGQGGLYRVDFRAALGILSANATEEFFACLGNATVADYYALGSVHSGPVAGGADTYLVSTGSKTLVLAAGDVVSLWTSHTTGATRMVLGVLPQLTSWEIMRIG
jgi:hypothetical protein